MKLNLVGWLEAKRKGLILASWIAFLASAATTILGGLAELRYGKVEGLLIAYAGFIGLALSGLLMTIAYALASDK